MLGENEQDLSWRGEVALEAPPITARIESFIRSAPNKALLAEKLETLGEPERLLRFLHRFLIFNDALAARVPYLAGLIHLTPDLFVDPEDGPAFCGQRNGRIAAYVAEAASDEYRLTPGRNLVHQHLSQVFWRAILKAYGTTPWDFEREHPVPAPVERLLGEARSKFFVEPGSADIFAALGFHVGLEFFANEEFNLVDAWLRRRHPALVEALEREDGGGACPYLWLSLHTIVEIGHYRAGLEAASEAVGLYRRRADAPIMAERLMGGLQAFADLQRRYYETILSDVV